MNPISAALQSPTPKPDRDVGPSGANDDTQQPATGRESAFGSMLRELSGGRPASPANSDAGKGKPDDAENDAPPAAAAAPAPAPAMPASSAAALLANLLSVATPPALATAPAPAPIQDQSIVAAPAAATASLSTSSPGSTAASVGGSLPGPLPVPTKASSEDAVARRAPSTALDESPRADSAAPAPERTHADDAASLDEGAGADGGTRTDDGVRLDGLVRTDIAKVVRAAAAKVEVLGSAVHFKPVVPAGAPAPDAANAGPTDAAATEAGAAVAQVARPEGPAMNAAAALKLAPQIRSEPDPRRPVAPVAEAEAGSERSMETTPAQGRVVSGVERAVLAAVGERAEDTAASEGSRDGTATSLPAGSLPMIATAIKDELDRATAAGSQSRIQADPAAPGIPGGPMRMLKIQLRPDDLGVVTVEMRLSNGQLETHLRASQPETAALLHKDTAILTDLLNQGGYKADVIVGQARPTETGAGSGGSQQQASPSFTDGGARPGNEGAGQRQDEQRQATGNRREGERTDEAVRPRDGGVYL